IVAVPPGPASKTAVRSTPCPGSTLAAEAVKLVRVGTNEDENVTVVCFFELAVMDPWLSVAVREYVVVAEGLTLTLVLPVTSPTPLSIARLVVMPTTFHLRVLLWPLLICEGSARKLVIVGGLTTFTVACLSNLVPVPSIAIRS